MSAKSPSVPLYVAAATFTEPGPTSGKLRPTKYPDFSVDPLSEVSKPTLRLAKSKV